MGSRDGTVDTITYSPPRIGGPFYMTVAIIRQFKVVAEAIYLKALAVKVCQALNLVRQAEGLPAVARLQLEAESSRFSAASAAFVKNGNFFDFRCKLQPPQ